MKNKRKLLAMLLAVVLCMTAFSFSAYAADGNPGETTGGVQIKNSQDEEQNGNSQTGNTPSATVKVTENSDGSRTNGITACDECHDTARTHLIECLGKEVIVDGEAELVILRIADLILTERNIADGKVEKVFSVCRLKACHGNIGIGIKLLCNAACDAVQFHAVELTVGHFGRQHTEEIADAHGRFQDITGGKAHSANRVIDGADNRRACKVGVQGRCPCRGVFLRGKGRIQLLKFL